jgi:hypothetical protein
LDEIEEFTEHQYEFRPQDPSKHANLLGYQVVEELNTPSAHLSELHTSGMRHET